MLGAMVLTLLLVLRALIESSETINTNVALTVMQVPASLANFEQVLFKYKIEIYIGVYRLVAVRVLEKQGRLYCLSACRAINIDSYNETMYNMGTA